MTKKEAGDLFIKFCEQELGWRFIDSLPVPQKAKPVQWLLDLRYLSTSTGPVHNRNEKPINPDPDGVLAAAWESSADQIIQMIERARPTMAKHAGRFGWPTEINEKDGKR